MAGTGSHASVSPAPAVEPRVILGAKLSIMSRRVDLVSDAGVAGPQETDAWLGREARAWGPSRDTPRGGPRLSRAWAHPPGHAQWQPVPKALPPPVVSSSVTRTPAFAFAPRVAHRVWLGGGKCTPRMRIVRCVPRSVAAPPDSGATASLVQRRPRRGLGSPPPPGSTARSPGLWAIRPA